MSDLKDFIRWLQALEAVSPQDSLSWDNYRFQGDHKRHYRFEEMVREQFLEETKKALDNKENKYIYFDGWAAPVALIGRKAVTSFCYGLKFNSSRPLQLSRLSCKELNLGGGPIELEDIWADTLIINFCPHISLVNCFVGTIRFEPVGVSTFEMRGGAVMNIECSNPSAQGPFTGSVYFNKHVYFPRKPGVHLKSPQPYRNMRAHMLKLENTSMVSLFHTLEQATERKIEGYGFHRGISALYELLSDYGSSALRPFLWFILLFAVTSLAVFLTDGATHVDAQELSGWQHSLNGDDWSAQVIRAFVLAGQSTLNPDVSP